MILRAHAPQLAGLTCRATLDHPPGAEPVLVLEGGSGGPVSPAEAELADYEVLDATEAELWDLVAGGYDLRGMRRR
jgi:hypothetical protein